MFLGFGFFGLRGLDGTVSRVVVGATRVWNGRYILAARSMFCVTVTRAQPHATYLGLRSS